MEKKITTLILLVFFGLPVISLGQADVFQIIEKKNKKYDLINTKSNKKIYNNCRYIQSLRDSEFRKTDTLYKRILLINTSRGETVIFDKSQGITLEKIPQCNKIKMYQIGGQDFKNEDQTKLKKVIYGVTSSKKKWIDDYSFLLNLETTETRGLFPNELKFSYDIQRKWVIVKSRKDYLILNEDFDTLFPAFSSFIETEDGFFYSQLAENQRWGIFDKDRKTLVPFQYCHLTYLGDSLFAASNSSGKVGVINVQNQTVIPFDYECLREKYYKNACDCSEIVEVNKDGLFIFQQNGKKVLIDQSKRIVNTLGNFYSVERIKNSDSLLRVYSDNGKGIYDLKNLIYRIPSVYRNIYVTGNYALVERNNRIGIICILDGEVITPLIYEADFKRYKVDNVHYYILEKEGRKGIITSDNIEKLSFIYDEISEMENYLLVKLKGKYGLFQKSSFKEILPIEFSNINVRKSQVEKYQEGEIVRGSFSEEGEITWF